MLAKILDFCYNKYMTDIKKIQRAIKFAIKTHEVYQKQKRKGKDIAYITHPLTVGIILSRIGANDDIICAGILHDTMEDSISEKKVTYEMLKERFGEKVAKMVSDVTEQNKGLSWEERKKLATEHVKKFSEDSLLLKSADVISNLFEVIDDYYKEGDIIFKRFNAPEPKKETIINSKIKLIETICEAWDENPLKDELISLVKNLEKIKANNSTEENISKIKQ